VGARIVIAPTGPPSAFFAPRGEGGYFASLTSVCAPSGSWHRARHGDSSLGAGLHALYGEASVLVHPQAGRSASPPLAHARLYRANE
jgi:hypothetical protein